MGLQTTDPMMEGSSDEKTAQTTHQASFGPLVSVFFFFFFACGALYNGVEIFRHPSLSPLYILITAAATTAAISNQDGNGSSSNTRAATR
jgi:hypothetical protein